MPELRRYRRSLARRWSALSQALFNPQLSDGEVEGLLRAARDRQPPPVIWLLGCAQSGKSSIVRALTGDAGADIGSGFRACTRTASRYDYPPEVPLVQFLDTRGLGEVAYDPSDDIAYCEGQAQLVVATVRAMEPVAGSVMDTLRAIRQRHPEWPLVVAQTCLHEAYQPGTGHMIPYPFGQPVLPEALPVDLRRSLRAQRSAVEQLPGKLPPQCVPVDLTPAEEGYEPADYGLEALWQALETLLPHSLRELLAADTSIRDRFARAAESHIRGYALAAAAVGALPAAGALGVPALQGKLLHSLAAVYGVQLDRRLAAEFLAALGLGIGSGYLARYAGRELLKLMPGLGQTVGAVWGGSTSGATTYALGRAACVYFRKVRDDSAVDVAAVRRVYADAFNNAALFLERRERDNR